MTNLRFVHRETTRFTELRRRLVETVPDIDEATLFDTLEGATELKEALACLIRSALEDEVFAKALKIRLRAMKTRLERLEASALKKREVVLAAMEESDVDKIKQPDFTASLRTVPGGIIITNEDVVPEWFWIPQPSKLDKRGIHEAMKAGTLIEGADFDNSRVTLTIRTK